MYLQPKSIDDFNEIPNPFGEEQSSVNLHAALRIMYVHSHKLDPSKVCSFVIWILQKL